MKSYSFESATGMVCDIFSKCKGRYSETRNLTKMNQHDDFGRGNGESRRKTKQLYKTSLKSPLIIDHISNILAAKWCIQRSKAISMTIARYGWQLQTWILSGPGPCCSVVLCGDWFDFHESPIWVRKVTTITVSISGSMHNFSAVIS